MLRPRHLLLTSLLALIGLLLAGCGTPAAAPAPPTATPAPTVAPTDTTPPQPPTDTPSPAPTNTPTPIPTATPVPLDVVTHTVSFPDVSISNGSGATVVVAPRTQRVVYETGGVLRSVDPVTGRVTGPLTVTADSGSRVAVALDDAHARADVVLDSQYGLSPTLTRVDLIGGQVTTPITLTGLPQTNVDGVVTDPATGGVLISLASSGETFSAGVPAQLVRLSPSGAVRRQRAVADSGALYLDPGAGLVVVATTTNLTETLAGYDARSLAPRWTAISPYVASATVLDLAHQRLWLLATGGRATIYDLRGGRVAATCDPAYTKPAQWRSNDDLVVDPRSGVGYVSWNGGDSYPTRDQIDRIDPTARTRTLLAPQGGVLVGVTARTGRLISRDDQGDLILRDEHDGHILGTLAPNAAWNGGASTTIDNGPPVVAQQGPTVIVAHAATVPYQDPVSGSTTASGIVVATLVDRP